MAGIQSKLFVVLLCSVSLIAPFADAIDFKFCMLINQAPFALDDIDNMVSKSKKIKKEKEQLIAEAFKLEFPTPRPKITAGKKRKLDDTAEVANFEGMDCTEAYKKLHVLSQKGLEQMTRCYESVVKEADEAKQMVSDLQKIAAAKNKKIAEDAKELSRVKMELERAHAKHAQDLGESYELAKKSAAISIFQARIKMAMEADNKDFDRAAWDV